jgi:hypothetical protein
MCKLSVLIAFLTAFISTLMQPDDRRPTTFGHYYGILYTDTYYFYIQEEIDGEYLGIDYNCNSVTFSYCTIYSYVAPDILGRIDRRNATVISQSASFEDLNLSQ